MAGSIIPAADVSASALNAERVRLQVIAQNIANMNTTQGPDGGPYRRKQVVFENLVDANGVGSGKVNVARIEEDKSPLIKMYMPGHPHADQEGMVTMPNVSVVSEMADMMTATRSFEANLEVIKAGRSMLNESLDLGTR